MSQKEVDKSVPIGVSLTIEMLEEKRIVPNSIEYYL